VSRELQGSRRKREKRPVVEVVHAGCEIWAEQDREMEDTNILACLVGGN
tara:strand:+ start:369 stop:515 length:147 start_codon:yes stop_codon:yes gene_type:complete